MKKWRSMDLFGSVENLFHPSSPSDSKTKSFRKRLNSLSSKDDSSINKSKDGENPTTESTDQMIQRCVIVQRDDKGYGLTVSGDNPVFVQSVKAEGAAAKCGVQEGDKILKVNGTLVTNKNHIDVVKLIKSGPLVALTLLGKPPPNSLDKSATIITPIQLSSSSNRITPPQPVDPEKDKELRQQKVHTTRAMYDQAREDLERLQKNYVKNPSEKFHQQLAEKERTVKKLEEQLKAITGNTDLSPLTPSFSDTEKSPMDQNSNTSWRRTAIRHSKQASVPASLYATNDIESRMTTSVSRSKSDVTTRRQATFTSHVTGFSERFSLGNSQTASLPSSSGPPTMTDSESPPTSPSISPTPSHPSDRRDIEESSSPSKADSGIEDGSNQSLQRDIITIDDEDMNSEEDTQVDGKQPTQAVILNKLQKLEAEDGGLFSDITMLEKKLGHLGIFIHYLISNSDPSPVFFYLISDIYYNAQGSVKDMKKWAYEIYSTFLAPNATLSAGIGDGVISQIDSALKVNSSKTTTEKDLRSVFDPARQAVKTIIQDLLADFRRQKDLGLGNIWGAHELNEVMDRSSEIKILEKYLIPHMTRLGDERNKSDREQAMAWALASFLRQVITSKSTLATSLDRVQSFVMKDKRKFPMSSKGKKQVKNHQFTLTHYYMVTFCHQCNSLIWGVGYQGYQCSTCEINVHKQCIDDVSEVCSKKKNKRPISMIPVIPMRNKSNPNSAAVNEALREIAATNAAAEGREIITQPLRKDDEAERADTLQFIAGLTTEHSVKAIVSRYEVGGEEQIIDEEPADAKDVKKKDIGRSESMKGRGDSKRDSKRRSKSDVDVDDSTIKSLNQSESSSTSSLGVDNNTDEDIMEDVRFGDDSDLDVETDLKSLKEVVGEDVVKKLKPKEKKRQEVLNELFHTERAHVRNLKILDKLFFRPMVGEAGTKDLAKQLLPNIHQMIRLHSSLNNAMKSMRRENPVIGDVGEMFLRRFDGEEGEIFQKACAIFCRGQSHALECLKKHQRKEQRFSQFLNETESNPLCRRLQLKDLVPTQFQRLTKYPLLIENLLKYTSTNSKDYKDLTLALQKTKSILAGVNQSVKDFENEKRLCELEKRIEKKIPPETQEKRRQLAEDMKSLKLTEHKLVYEGELTWRLRPNRLIDMHVVLLEDILVLLQKQDEKLVLKCQNTNVHTTSDLKGDRTTGGEYVKGYTHSPILKLQNVLSRHVAIDKKAFFVINTSEAGPQIYELIAATQDSRKKWHMHINSWSDSCKKSNKPSTTPSPGPVATNQPQEITEIRDRIKVRHPENLARTISTTSGESTAPSDSSQIGEVAEVRSEPDLVQPAEVKVSNTTVASSKAVLTPLEQLKKNGDNIAELLNENEKILSSQYSQCSQQNNHSTMPELSYYEDQGSRSLIVAAFQQMDDFTRQINTGCQSLISQPQDSTQSNSKGNAAVPIPMATLKDMSVRMNAILTNLMSAVAQSDDEKDRLRIELKEAQEQLKVLNEIKRHAMASQELNDSRPSSMVSIESSEQGETTEEEDEEDTAQESDVEMIVNKTASVSENQPSDSTDVTETSSLHDIEADDQSEEPADQERSSEEATYVDRVESHSFQELNTATISQVETVTENVVEAESVTSHVSSDDHVVNTGPDKEVDHVTISNTMNTSDNSSENVPLCQSESPMDTSSHSNTGEGVSVENNFEAQDLNSSSLVPELQHNSSDSYEGANFSDSDSTVTPVPFSSEMADSDMMAKSDATLVGSINSILSDSEISQDASNVCDSTSDSQRTSEKSAEPVKSEGDDGIEI